MTRIINTESFDKGEAFENYLQNTIFTKDKYDLIHKTHNFKQNSTRFPEESRKPDFKFRSKKSNKEFYVEAKFRSNYNNEDKLDLFNYDQFIRFKEINSSENIVLIAVGVGGIASNPTFLSLIPIEKIEFRSPYQSFIKNYEVTKKPINEDILHVLFNEYSKQITQESKREEVSKPLNKKLIPIAIVAVLLLISFLIFNPIKSKLERTKTIKIENKLKERIKGYYKAIESKNVDVMTYYINDQVSTWYTKTNVNLDFIKYEAKKYFLKYPDSNVIIDWESFEFSVLPNGDYSVSYNMVLRKKQKIEESILSIT